MSEGDNSVFSEGGITPVDPQGGGMDDKDQENASGNESEEVDDIELIFTTDESKDMSNLQVFFSFSHLKKAGIATCTIMHANVPIAVNI